MSYYCDECEMVIRDADVDEAEYFIGEAWGRPIYEKALVCPCCGENVREFYGDEELERIYGNPFDTFKNILGRSDDYE